MDLELEQLKIIETTGSSENSLQNQSNLKNSAILNEVYKENEELSKKLKVNYRRLILYEAENKRLLEEKNALYFENQHLREKDRFVTVKEQQNEKEMARFSNEITRLNKSLETLETENKAKGFEIQRFKRFHLKIQHVVKPFIHQLKSELTQLRKSWNLLTEENKQVISQKKIVEEKYFALEEQVKKLTHDFQVDKKNTIQGYEEQIHLFSQEILDLQERNESRAQEIARLKKASELKNYFENEVVRFKRLHDEDLVTQQDLAKKNSLLSAQNSTLESTAAELKKQVDFLKLSLEKNQENLESTRLQLSRKIEENSGLHERVMRLDKLNQSLSAEFNKKN